MDLPVLAILPDGSRRLFERAEAFSCKRTLTAMRPQHETVTTQELYVDKETKELVSRDVEQVVTTYVEVEEEDIITHPAGALTAYTEAELEVMCPGWNFLPVSYTDFDYNLVSAVKKPVEDWIIHEDRAEVTYTVTERGPAQVPVPRSVTNFQARAALLQAGLFNQVNDAIMAEPPDSTARQAWEYANEVTRNGALVNGVAAQLGLTSEQMDDLFRVASTIEA